MLGFIIDFVHEYDNALKNRHGFIGNERMAELNAQWEEILTRLIDARIKQLNQITK